MIPEDVVQRQLDTFNAHDLEAFLESFTDDVVIHDLLDGSPILEGRHAFRARYERVFRDRPRVHAELVGRIVIGDIVVDRERLTDGEEHPPEDALAIYEVVGDRVRRMWFIEPPHRRS
jgi:uncharacterized protein (TIGR02246 family)